MPDSFEIGSVLKQGNVFLPKMLKIALECAIIKIKDDKNRLTLSDLDQLFIYEDNFDLIGDSRDALEI